MEVGRLTYLLGRQSDGVAKFVEAIEQNEARDQSYIDALSFLVQRGDVDAALDIYRRAMSRPSRTVSEYVKVYSSHVDRRPHPPRRPRRRTVRGVLPARAGRPPGAPAPAAGGRLVHRSGPLLAGAWSATSSCCPRPTTPASGPSCTSTRPCAAWPSGQSDDAHDLWNKVLQTHMVEFLEFDMASRYLRTGAPTRAAKEDSPVGRDHLTSRPGRRLDLARAASPPIAAGELGDGARRLPAPAQVLCFDAGRLGSVRRPFHFSSAGGQAPACGSRRAGSGNSPKPPAAGLPARREPPYFQTRHTS